MERVVLGLETNGHGVAKVKATEVVITYHSFEEVAIEIKTHRVQDPSGKSEETDLNASCILHRQARENRESLRPYRGPGATMTGHRDRVMMMLAEVVGVH